MGGADLADHRDQRVQSYQHSTKTWVWYKKFFLPFEVAIMDAFLLERKIPHHNPSVTTKSRNMLVFRRELTDKPIGGRVYRKRTLENQPPAAGEKRSNLQLGHFPVLLQSRSHCKVHMQRVDTAYACSVCNIWMCPVPRFQRFYTLENYSFDDPTRNDRQETDVVSGNLRGRPRKWARGRLSV